MDGHLAFKHAHTNTAQVTAVIGYGCRPVGGLAVRRSPGNKHAKILTPGIFWKWITSAHVVLVVHACLFPSLQPPDESSQFMRSTTFPRWEFSKLLWQLPAEALSTACDWPVVKWNLRQSARGPGINRCWSSCFAPFKNTFFLLHCFSRPPYCWVYFVWVPENLKQLLTAVPTSSFCSRGGICTPIEIGPRLKIQGRMRADFFPLLITWWLK